MVNIMLDYRIETFLTVCREMNYTKAAEILNITQPNVSQHIKWLEDLYHQKLFIYQGRRLRLTQAGERLKNVATGMFHEEKLLRKQIAVVRNQKENLAFGVTKSINEGFMKERINRFLENHAGSTTYFTVNNTKQLLADIDSMRLDFAIIEGNFDKSIYDYIVLSEERFIPVCSAGYSFQEEIHDLKNLFSEPLIIREQGSGSREILEYALGSRNETIQSFASVMEIGDIGVTKELLKAGMGVAFLYEMAVRQEIEEGSLKEIRLRDFDICHEFAFVWMRTKYFSSYYRELAEDLCKETRKEQISDA